MGNRPGAPLYAGVNITTKCNLRCTYCYMQPLSGEHMRPEDFEHVLDELRENRLFMVCLAGGEPLTHPSACELLERATSTMPHTVLITNGTAIRPQHLRTFASIRASGRRLGVQVSIDSVDPLINARTRTRSRAIVANLERLNEIGLVPTVAMVVTTRNIDDMPRSIRVLSRYTRQFHLMGVQAPRRAPHAVDGLQVGPERMETLWDRIDDLAEELGLRISSPRTGSKRCGTACGAPCSGAFSYLVVDPDLTVRPCDQLTDVVLGNLRTQTLKEIWTGSPMVPVMHASDVPYCRRGELPLAV